MKTLMLEVRDAATFIPVIAIEMRDSDERNAYLLRRAGYGETRCILLTRAEGGNRGAKYDPYDWGDRTYQVAHHYIAKHWDELSPGDVIDVEFILKEKPSIKLSERYPDDYVAPRSDLTKFLESENDSKTQP